MTTHLKLLAVASLAPTLVACGLLPQPSYTSSSDASIHDILPGYDADGTLSDSPVSPTDDDNDVTGDEIDSDEFDGLDVLELKPGSVFTLEAVFDGEQHECVVEWALSSDDGDPRSDCQDCDAVFFMYQDLADNGCHEYINAGDIAGPAGFDYHQEHLWAWNDSGWFVQIDDGNLNTSAKQFTWDSGWLEDDDGNEFRYYMELHW